MVVLRIAVLCGGALALGGCLARGETSGINAAQTALVVSDAALPPSPEPGQILKPGLGGARGGIDPSAELKTSQRARVAWAPLRPDRLSQPPAMAAHPTNLTGMSESADPAGTASVTPTGQSAVRRGAAAPVNDREAAMDRLEREGHRDSKAICSGC
jgi:hypothetical protein